MRVTFLGTAAANAFPEAFCSCANCQAARALGGRSLRKRSAALINDDLLIDLGPDIMVAAMQHGCPLTNVRYCLQTHAHDDHLDPSHLLSRSPGYGVVGAPRLHYYASQGTLDALAETLTHDTAPHSLFDDEIGEQLNLAIHPIVAGECYAIGPYQVYPLAAHHDPRVEPLLYVISYQGRSILYGCDTGPLLEPSWQMLKNSGVVLDLAILDHTYGPKELSSDHLSAQGLIQHAQRLRDEGLLAEGARIMATHIAHEGNPAYPELAAFAATHGYEIAYDGLVVEV